MTTVTFPDCRCKCFFCFFSWKSVKICKGKLGTAPLIASVVLDLESRSAQQDNGFTEGSEWGRRSELLMLFLHIWISFKPQIQKPPKRSLLINRVSDQTTPGSLRCDYFRLSARINCVAADDCFIMDSSADHNLDSLFKKTWTTKTGEGFPVQELRVAVGYFPWIGASFNKEPLHFLLMQNPQWMGVTGAKSLKYLLTLLL